MDTLEAAIKHFEERRELCLKTATLSPDMGVKVSSSARAETYLYVNLILSPLLRKQAADELTQQAEANGEYSIPDDLYVTREP